jgi:uncharacterized protein YfiM (DUF2279 family)
MATAPLRSGLAETSSSRRVLGSPLWYEGRAVAGDPAVDEELVLVDEIQPVQLSRELAATEEHAGRGRVLELLHARAQVAGDVMAVGPREVLSRRRRTYFGFASSLSAHSTRTVASSRKGDLGVRWRASSSHRSATRVTEL